MRLLLFAFWVVVWTVGLGAQDLPRIIRFDVTPSSITVGQAATVTWQVENASMVTISPGIGTVSLNGSRTVNGLVTTTYTLQASNGVGSAFASITLTVSSAPPPTFTVTQLAIDFGEVPPGSTLARTFTIFANTELTLDLVRSLPNAISATGGDHITVTREQPVTISVTFQPLLPGAASGGITLQSPLTGASVYVSVSGTSGSGKRHTIISQAGSGGGFAMRVLVTNLTGNANTVTLYRIGTDGSVLETNSYQVAARGTIGINDDETRRASDWTPQWIWLESDDDIAAYAIQEYENSGARAMLVTPGVPASVGFDGCVAEFPVIGRPDQWPRVLVSNLTPNLNSYTVSAVSSDNSIVATRLAASAAPYGQETWDPLTQPVNRSISGDFAGLLRLKSSGPVAVATSGAEWPQLIEAFGTCGNSASASSSGIALGVQGPDSPARLLIQNTGSTVAANAVAVKRIDFAGNVVEVWNTTIARGETAVWSSTVTPEIAPVLSWYGIEADQPVNVYTDSGIPARAQPASASFVVPARIAGGDTAGLVFANPGLDAAVVWLDVRDPWGATMAHTCYTLPAGNGTYIQPEGDPVLSGLADFTGSFWISASQPVFASLAGISEDTLFAVPTIPVSAPNTVVDACPADSSAPSTSAVRPRARNRRRFP